MKRAAIIVLINSKKQILFQLRDNKPEIIYPGYWGLIGGGIEPGESELEAVKREIYEEINLNIEPFKKIGMFHLDWANIDNHVFVGRLEKKVEEIKLNEGQRVKFFSLKDIKKIKTPKHLKEFLFENKEEIFSI